MRSIYLIGYYGVCGILLFSGALKIYDPEPTAEVLKAAFKLSDEPVLIISTLLSVFEIMIALLMILKLYEKRVLLLVFVLFICFFAFSVYGTIIGLNIDCGCFGNAVQSEFGLWMILRNLILTIIAFLLMKTNRKFASAGHLIKPIIKGG